MNITKPPLGVMPRWLHDLRRIEDLGAAIDRYKEANMPVSQEWLDEYEELRDKLTTR